MDGLSIHLLNEERTAARVEPLELIAPHHVERSLTPGAGKQISRLLVLGGDKGGEDHEDKHASKLQVRGPFIN